MKVAVIGAGKMGLPLACQFASRGAEVSACDLRQEVVDAINAGRSLVDEPGVPEILSVVVREGRLRATTDTLAAVAESEVIVVIVPAVLDEQREADLSVVLAVTEQVAGALRKGAMVSYETTVPVGTTRDRMRPLLERSGLIAGRDFDLVYSPERIKSRTVLQHLGSTPKVVGGITPESAARAAAFYQQYLGAPVVNLGTLEAAEMVKVAGMVYRDVNIALANELARYSEALGVDLEPVLEAANTDTETYLLRPGIGVGGHCTPVYPYFLIHDAAQRGAPVTLAERGRRINDAQAGHMMDRLDQALGGLRGRRVLLLGLAFRPGVKEHLYSPAFLVRDELVRRGAEVRLHDSLYSEQELRGLGFTPGRLEDKPAADALTLITGHPEYAALDLAGLARRGTKAVVDGRSLWPPDAVRQAGLIYIGVGYPDSDRPAPPAASLPATELRNTKVLITGGAGLVGSHIADQVAGRAREVVVLDNFVRGRRENLQNAMASGRVRIVEGDIRDRKLLAEVMAGVDILFHQAAIRITQCAVEPRLALEVMADGTFNVLEAAVQAKVKRVVAASSASVYGLAEEFPTSERHPPYNNRTLYGATKTFNEGLLRAFHEMYGLPYVALRYFNVYGPRMDIHGVYTEVLIRWMERISAGQPPLIFGDGSQTMDFVYIEDIARANVLAAESGACDEIFNVASGVETSLQQLADTLLKVMGSDLKVEYGPERRVNPVARRLADTRAARERLGFAAQVSLEEGLRRLVTWYQEEGRAKEKSQNVLA